MSPASLQFSSLEGPHSLVGGTGFQYGVQQRSSSTSLDLQNVKSNWYLQSNQTNPHRLNKGVCQKQSKLHMIPCCTQQWDTLTGVFVSLLTTAGPCGPLLLGLQWSALRIWPQCQMHRVSCDCCSSKSNSIQLSYSFRVGLKLREADDSEAFLFCLFKFSLHSNS